MIIYISGPMSGIPELNFPAFDRAAARLRELGHEVISPHEVLLPEYPKGYEPKTSTERMEMWLAFMRSDIKALMDADTVATLPGWEQSKGARIEVELAKSLSMTIVSERSL